MQNHALSYAARGWHVFPVPVGTRRSHIAAKRDGGPRWGASCDPDTLRRYWTTWPAANIGIATGAISGVWVLDVDTDAGHGVDGFASLASLPPLPPTLASESPSGSRHYYWNMPALLPGQSLRNSTGALGDGLDVRGDGGMVIAPPSGHRMGGAYRWLPGPDAPADAPDWLLARVISTDTAPVARRDPTPEALAEVADLLAYVEPDAGGYDQWQRVLAAIHDASDGSAAGLDLADSWSERGDKYRAGEVADKWSSFTAGRTGGATIATIAEYAKRAGADVVQIAQRHRLMRAFGGNLPGVTSDLPAMPGAGGAPAEPDPIDLILQAIQTDPSTAPHRLAAEIARLSPDDRARVLTACRAYGIKQDMAAAVKRADATHTAGRYADKALPALSHYYVIENEGGQAVAFDARGDRQPQTRAQLRDALSWLPEVPVTSGDSVRFVHAVDHWWGSEDTPRYNATGYDPLGGVAYLDDQGRSIRNTYLPPHAVPPVPGDVMPFLHILNSNFPDPGDQSKLLDALAVMCQRPGVILRWAVVMQGVQGCGKGSLAQAVTYCHGLRNTSHPSPDVIATDFNGYMLNKTLIVVNEIGDHTKRELGALAEKLKPWITDSPVSIHAKGREARDMPNYCNWIFTTNHKHCMLAAQGERRYMHLISDLQTEDDANRAFPASGWWQTPGDWWTNYHAWWAQGGAEHVRAFLLAREVQHVPSRAPATTSTAEALRMGDGAVSGLIRAAIDQNDQGFRGGWVSANAVRDLLDAEGVRLPGGPTLTRIMEALGYRASYRPHTSPGEAMRFPRAAARSRLYHTGPAGAVTDAEAMLMYDAAQRREDGTDRGGAVVRMPGV